VYLWCAVAAILMVPLCWFFSSGKGGGRAPAAH